MIGFVVEMVLDSAVDDPRDFFTRGVPRPLRRAYRLAHRRARRRGEFDPALLEARLRGRVVAHEGGSPDLPLGAAARECFAAGMPPRRFVRVARAKVRAARAHRPVDEPRLTLPSL